jgi:hypothetical protein
LQRQHHESIRFILLLSACLGSVTPVFPQATKAELFGTVRDPAGLPVEAADVELTNAATQAIGRVRTARNGEYRFRFDLALVDRCRTQYVRVTAQGYESRLLVLMVGQNVQSEDVLLKKK